MNRLAIAIVGSTLLVLATCAVAVGALSDSAKLTPGGLGRLEVGMTEHQVERVLDRNIVLNNNAGGGECATAGLRHRAYALFTNGRLGRVTLGSRHYATKSGLRVGMPESAIKQKYGARAKRSKHEYAPDGSYYKVTRGHRRLVFETDGTKITAISGGRIPEVDYVEGCA